MNKIIEFLKESEYFFNQSLKNHCSFKIGGKCKLLINIAKQNELVEVIKYLKSEKINYLIIGNASNILFDDRGYNGVIIKIADKFNQIYRNANILNIQAGASNKEIAKYCIEQGLSGYEALSGIPGSIGGALYMNAGAYGVEIYQLVQSVTILNSQMEIEEIDIKNINYAYRYSSLANEDNVILSVKIKLEKAKSEQVLEKVNYYTHQRMLKQPLEYPSAGSVFKRPKNNFASKLIDDAKLRGYQIGGAAISKKHAGFIINKHNASFQDVCDLIAHIQKVVEEQFNIKLEREVKVINYEEN